MAGWNREQNATIKLLANNFQDKKWRLVAQKNAYALLGKHRHGSCKLLLVDVIFLTVSRICCSILLARELFERRRECNIKPA